MFSLFWQHRSLILELYKRDLSGRYKGTIGGWLWFLVQPIYLLSIYTIAFGVILKHRVGFSNNTAEYALMLFSGLIIFNAFSECLTQSSTLITKNPGFVKKIVFPLEILPLITVLSALFHALIGIAVWCLGYGFLFGLPKFSVLYSLIILLSFAPLLLGISTLLAGLGVVLRDINYLTAMISHTFLFLTPIFYAYEIAPAPLQKLLLLNPLTVIVEQFRLVLYSGQLPSLMTLFLYFSAASLFASGTFIFFKQLRLSFSDLV